jgi:cobalt-zinc-cadmium efflux system outer membrane protein
MRRLLTTATLLPILWASGKHPALAQVVKIADDVILLSKGATKQQQVRTHQHLGVPGAESRLPPSPGSGVPTLAEPSAVRPLPGVLSGAAAQPGERYGGAEQPRILPPPRQVEPAVPLYGPLVLPPGEDEGPPDGLTLDAAIDRLVHANYDLLTKFQEIPKAQADILSAGLRLNPILFASVDNVPYGNYSQQRPGANSYEATLIQPIDVNQKRKDRIRLAQHAKRVLEAQYQDAVRLQIDNLYSAHVDFLEARETVRAARAGVAGLAEVVKVARELVERGLRPRTDVDRAVIQQANAEVALQGALTALGQARRNLATLLAVPAQQSDCIEVRGSLRDRSPPLPCMEELVRIALEARPDLAAYRLGVQRAEAAVQLARAERFEDLFLFYNPYTYTNNAPMGRQDAASWGAGVLVPLPVFNRNQGNIARARINVAQTQIELEGLERQVANEVQRAAAEAAASRAALGRYEQDILPAARRLREEEFRLFLKGQEGATTYLAAQREYNEVVRQYLEAIVRHRRNLLRLNTAVGERVVP